jgi:hypothetical protein
MLLAVFNGVSQLHRKIIAMLLAMIGLVVFSIPATADENTSPANAEPGQAVNSALPIRILIANPDNEPISGATITPVGLRTKAARGAHYSWTRYHGDAPTSTTGDDGIAEITYPQFVDEKLETGEVTWQVDHEDYVVFRGDAFVDDDPANITLRRGRRIAVAVIDAQTEKRVVSNLFGVLSGSKSENEWKTMRNGLLRSRAVEWNRRTLRIVHLPDDAPAQFSDPIDLNNHGETCRVYLRDIKLHAGTRVQGTIDAQVPRPVTNGVVSINVTVGSEQEEYQAQNTWTDWTTINKDGTFEFESLPRNALVQMIAVCDGWLSANPQPADLETKELQYSARRFTTIRVLPQLTLLEGDQIAPTINMETSASCRITVINENDQPIEGATVTMWPNQMWLKSGGQIVGDGASLRVAFKMSDEQRKLGQDEETRRNFYKELGVLSIGSDRNNEL